MFGDRWDCKTCHRGADYRCPIREELDAEELRKVVWEEQRGKQPYIFASDQAGICPRALTDGWGSYMWQAYQWLEIGGDLGTDFASAPKWLTDAIWVLGSQRGKAQSMLMELQRKTASRKG